jgi:hypothetical protein
MKFVLTKDGRIYTGYDYEEHWDIVTEHGLSYSDIVADGMDDSYLGYDKSGLVLYSADPKYDDQGEYWLKSVVQGGFTDAKWGEWYPYGKGPLPIVALASKTSANTTLEWWGEQPDWDQLTPLDQWKAVFNPRQNIIYVFDGNEYDHGVVLRKLGWIKHWMEFVNYGAAVGWGSSSYPHFYQAWTDDAKETMVNWVNTVWLPAVEKNKQRTNNPQEKMAKAPKIAMETERVWGKTYPGAKEISFVFDWDADKLYYSIPGGYHWDLFKAAGEPTLYSNGMADAASKDMLAGVYILPTDQIKMTSGKGSNMLYPIPEIKDFLKNVYSEDGTSKVTAQKPVNVIFIKTPPSDANGYPALYSAVQRTVYVGSYTSHHYLLTEALYQQGIDVNQEWNSLAFTEGALVDGEWYWYEEPEGEDDPVDLGMYIAEQIERRIAESNVRQAYFKFPPRKRKDQDARPFVYMRDEKKLYVGEKGTGHYAIDPQTIDLWVGEDKIIFGREWPDGYVWLYNEDWTPEEEEDISLQLKAQKTSGVLVITKKWW